MIISGWPAAVAESREGTYRDHRLVMVDAGRPSCPLWSDPTSRPVAAVQLGLLGPLLVTVGGLEVVIDAAQERAVLSLLALRRGKPTSFGELIDALWGDNPPRSARKAVQNQVAKLRRVLPPGTIMTMADGYALCSADVDVALLEHLVGEGRRLTDVGDVGAAVTTLSDALLLWRGPALPDLTGQAVGVVEAALLNEIRRTLEEDLADLRLGRGDHRALAADLESMVAAEPLRERRWGLLILALYRCGRQADALRAYSNLRKVLREELGIDPSTELQDLETAILRHNGDLVLEGHPVVRSSPSDRTAERDQPEPAQSGGLPLGDQVPVPPCPYRGLSAFREEDAAVFYGRQICAQALAAAVRTTPLVAALGASGSGKSSVVFAGVVPQLRAEGGWCVASMRPGNRPFHALAAALVPLLEMHMTETDHLVEVAKLARMFQEGAVGLVDVQRRILAKTGAERFVLIVDQFEDLYAMSQRPHELSGFMRLLLTDTPASSGMHCLVTLRSDCLGRALSYRPLAHALKESAIVVGPMSRDELRAVIEEPARSHGVAIEKGLTVRLLDAVGDEPGNLPLLQFALTLMWDAQVERCLTHDGYEAMGGLKYALSGYADDTYHQLGDDERARARRIFTQLVRPGDGAGDTRRSARRREVGDDNWEIVGALADARLLVVSRDEATGEEQVDIVHEALITSWERFWQWMAADRAFRVFQERLRAAVRQWESNDHDSGALLRGAPLGEATCWIGARGNEMSQSEKAFVGASNAAVHRRSGTRNRPKCVSWPR